MSTRVVKLSEVAEINPRRVSTDLSADDLVSFVPMEAVDEITGTLARPVERRFAEVRRGYTAFAENDVLFAKITPCMQNGKHAVAQNLIGGKGFGSTEFHVIRPSSEILPEWIHSFLRRRETLEAAVKTFTGTVGQQRVPEAFLENLELPLPSVEVQRRIASRLKSQLASVEKVRIAARLQGIEILQQKVLSLNSIFEGAGEWVSIGRGAKVQSGFAFKSQDFKTSGIRLLRNANIEPGRIYWDEPVFLAEADATKLESYRMHQGDVVLSLDRPIISSGLKVARVTANDLPSLLVQRVGRFLLNKDLLDADYLFAFLQTTHFIDAISGHDQSLGVPHISPGQVEAIQIPLPSVKEQRRIAAIASEVLSQTAKAHKASSEMVLDIARLPSRLLARAFDGATA